jgi:drug/metabolite transporter (DMT)-like permease
VVAVFLGWLVLHEKIDAFILAGSAVVIASVIVVTSASVAKKPKPLRMSEATAD